MNGCGAFFEFQIMFRFHSDTMNATIKYSLWISIITWNDSLNYCHKLNRKVNAFANKLLIHHPKINAHFQSESVTIFTKRNFEREREKERWWKKKKRQTILLRIFRWYIFTMTSNSVAAFCDVFTFNLTANKISYRTSPSNLTIAKYLIWMSQIKWNMQMDAYNFRTSFAYKLRNFDTDSGAKLARY